MIDVIGSDVAALLLGISKSTLLRAQHKDSPFYPLGHQIKGRYFWSASDLAQFAEWNENGR